LCRLLEVSRSGYYAWKERPECQDRRAPQVEDVFWRHSRRYGSRRITAELRDDFAIGRHRVRRLMREQGLQAIQPRRFVPRTTDSRHGQQMSPNLLLERAITVDHPHEVIVSDITYLPLQYGKWAYLATWMDLFSRKIVGWQVASTMTAELVIEALRQAILRERLPAGLIVHFVVARIELDDDFVVFGLPAGAKVVIFLKHCGRHRQLNDHPSYELHSRI
jgi:putative transposase